MENMKAIEDNYKMMMAPANQQYIPNPYKQHYNLNPMWTPAGDAYPQPKISGYGGGKRPVKKRKKPNAWCWTHGITMNLRHNSMTCKKHL